MTLIVRNLESFVRLVVIGVVISSASAGLVRGDDRSEDRSDLTVAKALVGHWQTITGKTDFYFTDDGEFTIINEDKSHQSLTYSVVSSDDVDETLKLTVKVKSTGAGHTKHLQFASDKLTLMSSIRGEMQGEKYSINLAWRYIDDAQRPPK